VGLLSPNLRGENTTVPNHQELLAIVDDDIRTGIGKVFTPSGLVRLQAPFTGVTLPTADVSFVPWEYDAKHDHPLNTTETGAAGMITDHGEGAPILPATNRTFPILGVTVVDARQQPVTLHRFVDWANVLANVGMGVSMRPHGGH
jgi:hypothetical protein